MEQLFEEQQEIEEAISMQEQLLKSPFGHLKEPEATAQKNERKQQHPVDILHE